MGLFSKKPGGTFFGNLLRGVASNATGGLLGNGLNRIELGQTKTNKQLADESGIPYTTQGNIFSSLFGGSATINPNGTISTANSSVLPMIATLLTIGLGIKLLFFPERKKYRK